MSSEPLSVTGRLVDLLLSADAAAERSLVPGRVAAIRRYGTRADAHALWPVVEANPEGAWQVLPVLGEHGDQEIATKLYDLCRSFGPGIDCEVLEGMLGVLGYLGHEAATDMLWTHARTGSPDACLGLANLSGRGLGGAVGTELSVYEGQEMFPEYLPALAFRTGDPTMVQRLAAWGRRASTDCNGGLLVGLAMLGPAGRRALETALWDPYWEVDDGGTGVRWAAHCAVRAAGISILDLHEGMLRACDRAPADAPHAISVFVGQLEMWLRRPWVPLRAALMPAEDPARVYRRLFDWSTPDRDDSLTGLARMVFEDADPIHLRLGALADRVLAECTHAQDLAAVRESSSVRMQVFTRAGSLV